MTGLLALLEKTSLVCSSAVTAGAPLRPQTLANRESSVLGGNSWQLYPPAL